jgi:hypothetical protein
LQFKKVWIWVWRDMGWKFLVVPLNSFNIQKRYFFSKTNCSFTISHQITLPDHPSMIVIPCCTGGRKTMQFVANLFRVYLTSFFYEVSK